MKFPNLDKLPPLDFDLREFQQFVRDVQKKYSQQYKKTLDNMDAYFLAIYLITKNK